MLRKKKIDLLTFIVSQLLLQSPAERKALSASEPLGNGLFVSYDDEHFCLQVPGTANVIWIDNDQMANLLGFITRATKKAPPGDGARSHTKDPALKSSA
jgi:hypothetical protein